jgi:hypothetical protein
MSERGAATDEAVALLRRDFPHVSRSTLNSLASMDEEVVNMDLIESLLIHILETSEQGAILVFLPGLMEVRWRSGAVRRCRCVTSDGGELSCRLPSSTSGCCRMSRCSGTLTCVSFTRCTRRCRRRSSAASSTSRLRASERS